MAQTRTALVTGANRGIGLETVRQLCRLGVIAVIGCRDVAKGGAAAAALASEGFEVPVVTLDVTSPASIAAAAVAVKKLLGRLDVLVNNAGIMLDGASGGLAIATIDPELVQRTFETNVLGPLRLIQASLPLMRENGYGRIVNLSSGLGQLADMGAGYPAYRMSKVALNALTRTAAAELSGEGIKVNAACPGWVQSDMGGPSAPRTLAQGAETPVWLATLPDDGPTSGFFRDKKPIAW